jgi:hypothetical protein
MSDEATEAALSDNWFNNFSRFSMLDAWAILNAFDKLSAFKEFTLSWYQDGISTWQHQSESVLLGIFTPIASWISVYVFPSLRRVVAVCLC